MRALSLATIISAGAGFFIIFLAPHALKVAAVAAFQAYWGLFFACTGILDGISSETTRTLRSTPSPQHGAQLWQVAALLSLGTALVVFAGSFAVIPNLLAAFPDQQLPASVLLAAGLAAYTWQAALLGALAGTGSWGRYSTIMLLDVLGRLLIVLASIALNGGLIWWLVTTVLGAATATGFLLADKQTRSLLHCRLGSSHTLVKHLPATMLASGAASFLINGFAPAVQAAAQPAANPEVVAALLLAITISRAPFLVPVQRFAQALIARFSRSTAQLVPILLGLLAAGSFGSLLAASCGPWVMSFLFGSTYQLSASQLAPLPLAAATVAGVLVTGTASLAKGQHRFYVAGLITAAGGSVVFLQLPGPTTTVVAMAMLAGPLLGMAVHVSGLRKSARNQPR